MARSIEHRATFPADTTRVYETLVDADFVRAKLERLGGHTAELIELSDTNGVTSLRTRHGIPSNKLPGPVRALLGGDLHINRTQTWRPDAEGFTGDFSVTIAGAPGSLTGTGLLRGTNGGCEQTMRGQIRVDIPLVGGKVEESVTGHITTLLDAEAHFTQQWLREH